MTTFLLRNFSALQQCLQRLRGKNTSLRCLSYATLKAYSIEEDRFQPNNLKFLRYPENSRISNDFPPRRCCGSNVGLMRGNCILKGIEEAISEVDLLDVFTRASSADQIGPAHITAALDKLVTIFYGQLEEYPWFQGHNQSISYIQLLMNGRLQPLSEDIRSGDLFSHLKKLVIEHFDELDSYQLSEIFLCFSRLGLEHYDPLYTKLVVTAPDLCDIAPFHALVNFCVMQLAQNRRNPVLIHRVLDRVSRDFDSFDFDVASLGDMVDLLLAMSYLMSDGLCRKFLDQVMAILKAHPEVMENPETLGQLLRLSRRVITRFPPDKVTYQVKIYNLCENALMRRKDYSIFNDSHVAEICSNLQYASRYRQELAVKFRQRSLELLEDTRVSVVSNLIYAFNSLSPTQEKRIMETALYKTIPQADLLLLSNLAESLRLMNCTNEDVLEKFHERLLENLDGVFEYVTRFEKIIRSLFWRNFINPEHERTFVAVLLDYLGGQKSQFGTRLWCIGMASTYLLQNTRYAIPQVLYNRLVDVIPQCSVKDLYPVMLAMNSFRRPMATSTQNQVYHLQTLIYASIIDRLDTIRSINLLTSMLKDLTMKNKNPDTNLVEKLMQLYVNFSDPDSLNEEKYMKIVNIHSRLSYYNPEVMDNLAVYASKNSTSLEMKKLMFLFSLLSKVGYVPKNVDHLVDVTLAKYEQEKNEMWIPYRVQLFRSFAELQIFPKKQVSDLFSLDFIQRVDKFITDFPSEKHNVEWNMMLLNRAVVLECPELDVPWFHEQYCQDKISTNESQSPFLTQFGDILADIVGGWQNTRKWVHTPYYYTINFEVVLDSKGKAVSLTSSAALPEDCQRLAIRCLFYSQYCYHRRVLNGFEKAKQRHLQLLGYKIVEIPLHDWNSMGLSDQESKVNYVKAKLYS